MVFSTELQVPYIITYALDFGPSGSVKTQFSSGYQTQTDKGSVLCPHVALIPQLLYNKKL